MHPSQCSLESTLAEATCGEVRGEGCVCLCMWRINNTAANSHMHTEDFGTLPGSHPFTSEILYPWSQPPMEQNIQKQVASD